MPIADYLNQTAALVTRSQHTLFTGDAAATLTLGAIPAVAFRLAVQVSGGTSNTGTVTSATGSKTETFTFSAAGSKIGTVLYSTKPTITTTGLADETTKPTVTVACIDSMGAPIMKEVETDLDIRLVDTSTRYELSPGVWTASASTAWVLPSAPVAVNSIIRYDSTDYIVRAVSAPRQRLGSVNHQKLALDLGSG